MEALGGSLAPPYNHVVESFDSGAATFVGKQELSRKKGMGSGGEERKLLRGYKGKCINLKTFQPYRDFLR